MESGCGNCGENIYMRCRKEAAKYNDKLNSRESAADLLGLSPSSLANYELGITKVVPVDKVVLMGDLYNSPELLRHYCKNECPIGCRRTMATEIKGIEQTTLGLLDIFADDRLDGFMRRLTRIAMDGKVTEDERANLTEIVQYMDILKVKLDELGLYAQKQKGAGSL